MAYTATAIEIDKTLRDDFRDRLKKYGLPTEIPDPVLAVLFRTFAQQLENLYTDIGNLRLALLDELIAGLGMERRAARPAQTVVRFVADSRECVVEAGTELTGQAQSGERLTFRTDVGIAVSGARLALALAYEPGTLRLLSGTDLPERLQAARPALDPVRASLGPHAALWLAIEGLPEKHLSRNAIFFEIGPDGAILERALAAETWCLAGFDGELAVAGILRPRAVNGCVASLDWLVQPDGAARTEADGGRAEVHSLTSGFYGPKAFVFPSIPEGRRFTCRVPRGLDSPIQKIFGREAASLFQEPRAWIRIGLPGADDLHRLIGAIILHAVTASNVDCLNQTINFERHGLSIPVSREAGTTTFLVAPVSVAGDSGQPYIPATEPSPELNVGRYFIRNGRLELRPPRSPGGRLDRSATVRLWVTSGALGNRVGPGKVQTLANRMGYTGLRIVNPTAAAGGSDVESFESARARFAQTLLSRDRIVTRDDLVAAVYAFDRRIRDVQLEPGLRRGARGLVKSHRVTVWLNRSQFVDSDAESRILQDDLTRMLRSRTVFDAELTVRLEWR